MTDGSFYGKRWQSRSERSRRNHVFPTLDEITERAHQLFVAQGRRVASMPDCWRRAEEELLDRAARRVLGR